LDFWQLICYALSMGLVSHKQELLENVIRLRRLGRDLPGNPDLAAVRVSQERELGEAVSRRLAARVLGISHTALERWVEAGDVPVLYSSAGRMEVPVSALLDLHEAVEADRAKGPLRFPLTPTMTRQRKAAQRLRVDPRKRGDVRSGHDRASTRSLAYHRAIARRLRKPMIDEARHVLFRWREQGRIDPRYAERWEDVLRRPVREIRKALVDESSAGDDLRQSSPFAGILSEPERRRVLREVT
jgi:hypothetical protein